MRNATFGIALLLILSAGIAGAGSFRCETAVATSAASASVCLVNEESKTTAHSWERKTSLAFAQADVRTGAYDSHSTATLGQGRTWATEDETGTQSGRESGSSFTTSGRTGYRVVHAAGASAGQDERAGGGSQTVGQANATVVDALLRIVSVDVSAGQVHDATSCRNGASADVKIIFDGSRLFPGAGCQSQIPYLEQSETASVLSDLLLP